MYQLTGNTILKQTNKQTNKQKNICNKYVWNQWESLWFEFGKSYIILLFFIFLQTDYFRHVSKAASSSPHPHPAVKSVSGRGRKRCAPPACTFVQDAGRRPPRVVPGFLVITLLGNSMSMWWVSHSKQLPKPKEHSAEPDRTGEAGPAAQTPLVTRRPLHPATSEHRTPNCVPGKHF